MIDTIATPSFVNSLYMLGLKLLESYCHNISWPSASTVRAAQSNVEPLTTESTMSYMKTLLKAQCQLSGYGCWHDIGEALTLSFSVVDTHCTCIDAWERCTFFSWASSACSHCAALTVIATDGWSTLSSGCWCMRASIFYGRTSFVYILDTACCDWLPHTSI